MRNSLVSLACLCLFPLFSVGQINDNFSGNSLEGWVQSPSNRWSIAVDGANTVLHHSYDNLNSGRDIITHPVAISSYQNGTLTWRFSVKYGFTPSMNNSWVFILASNADATQMNTSLPGRTLVLGVNFSGSDDLLKVWEQNISATGSKTVRQIAATTLNWETGVGPSSYGYIEVVRSAAGEWSIGFSKSSYQNTSKVGSFIYTTDLSIRNLGFIYWYSSNEDRKLWVGDVSLSYEETNIVDKNSEIRVVPLADTVIASTSILQTVTSSNFFIVDRGTKDGKATIVGALKGVLRCSPKAYFKVDRWKGAFSLMSGGAEIPSSVSMVDSVLTVTLTKPDTIRDGTSKDYRLMVNLPDSLVDGFSVAFTFDGNTPVLTASNSSAIGSILLEKGRFIRVNAVADRFKLTPVVKSVKHGERIAPVFCAIDRFGVIDVDFAQLCELTITGDDGISTKIQKKAGRGELVFGDIIAVGSRYFDLLLTADGVLPYKCRILLLNDTSSVVFGVEVATHEATVNNITYESAVNLAQFTLKDVGGDGLQTVVRAFDFAITSSKVDASKVVEGARLQVGSAVQSCRIAQLSKDALRVEVFDNVLNIDERDSIAVKLDLFFNPKEFVDLSSLSFSLKQVIADSASSIFASFGAIPVNTFNFKVTADTLNFSKIPAAVSPNTPFDIWVKASDRFGNTDTDYSGSCRLVIAGASTFSGEQAFTSGVAKFTGLRMAKGGGYSVGASSEILKVNGQFIIADNDSYLKVARSPLYLRDITSTSTFFDALKFLIVDTGTSDTLKTCIAQLTLQSLDTLGGIVAVRRIDSVAVLLNGIRVNLKSVSYSGGKMVLKLDDSALVVPNRSECEVIVRVKLAKAQAMLPFYITIPADGITLGANSSLISKTCSYAIQSDVIRYKMVADRILAAPYSILLLHNQLISLRYQLTTGDGEYVSTFLGRVAAQSVGLFNVNPIVCGGVIGINGAKAGDEAGDASVRLVANDTIVTTSQFRIAMQVDTLISATAVASKMVGWQRLPSGSYVHSGDEGKSLLCYALSPTAAARNTQWHVRFKLDNTNFSTENFMRLLLMTDRLPYKDSAYSAVALSYKKSGTKTFFQLETLVNGKVIAVSDTIYTGSIVGKMAEVYILKDDSGLFRGNVFIDGYRCCHFYNVAMPFTKVARYCGVEYQCSSSNVGKMMVDLMEVVGSEQHPRVVDGFYSSKGDASLTMNLPLSSTENLSVTASDMQYHPATISNVIVEGCQVHFRIGNVKGSPYRVKVGGVVNGQTFSDTCSIRIRAGLEFGDVTISEIMFDPTPSVGLPEVEYLELYNRIADTLSIGGWTVWVNGKLWKCSPAKVSPKGYLAISSVSGAGVLGVYGNVVGATGFDGLPNAKGDVAILNSQAKVIATSYYCDRFLASEGITGGKSLEKRDINSFAEGVECWASSKDSKGGTPGAVNSVSEKVVDVTPPEVEQLFCEEPNLLTITFNEPIVVGPSFAILPDGIDEKVFYRFNPLEPRKLSIRLSSDLSRSSCRSLFLTDVADYSGNKLTSEIVLALSNPPVKGDLLINEVLFNPVGDCSDYVEIVNASAKPIDLSGIVICRRNAEGKLDEVKRITDRYDILQPKAYALACSTPEIIALRYSRCSTACFKKVASMPSYPNDAGVVVIADTALNVIDELVYSEKMHFKMLPTFEGVSLERVGITDSRWQSAAKQAGYGTPGVANSQQLILESSTSQVTLASTIISPDGDGVNDYLAISYQLEKPGTMAAVDIFTSGGALVKTLCRNELLGTVGTIVWDGVTNGGLRVSRGIYIAIVKLVAVDGTCSEVRQVFSVAYR